MRVRIASTVLAFSMLAAQCVPVAVDTTVYVTRTGKKYHVSGCRYLRTSKIPMDLSKARRRYDPCKVCAPPIE